MKTNTLILAAGYLRMSSDKQETSLADQKKELIDYAKRRGFQIVKWYVDEGVSGWKNKQRHGFQALIADAQDGHFRAVLCWDQSRFSRFDPMEANYYWHILRRENVFIETVKEGRLDFETLGGWLSASVQQHGKQEYCKSLAADVARGRRAQIMAGKWITTPPFGYRLQSGKLVLGDAEHVEIVRRIFSMRAKGMGRRSICIALNEAGILSPRGCQWSQPQIRQMVTKETYLGHTVVGRFPTGKFCHLVDEVQVLQDTHPAIIDAELWAKVQQVNSTKRTRHEGRKPDSRSGAHLAGILRCGQCGEVLYGERNRQRYVCSTYHSGRGCSHNTIGYTAALKLVADKIRETVLMGSVEKLTAAIERVLAKRRTSRSQVDADAIKRQVAEIDRKLGTAADRLLEVEPSLVKDVRAAMLTLKEKRAGLIERLEALKQEKRQSKSAKEIAAGLWQLDRVLREGDPATVRAALSQIIQRVEISYESKPFGPNRRTWYPVGGTMVFSSIGETSSKSAFPAGGLPGHCECRR